jgi:hypothetical protein
MHLLRERVAAAPWGLGVGALLCAPMLALAQSSPFMTGATALQTKGRTLLAAAARLQAELPHADIRAFALIRTQGFVPHLGSVFESCHGVIRWAGGDARREP